MRYRVTVNGEPFEVELEPIYEGLARSMTSGQLNGDFSPKIEQPPTPKATPVVAPAPAPKPEPKAAPAPKPAPAPKAEAKPAAPAAPGSVVAPMPGNVWEVKVKEGDSVKAGDVIMILEAMKMEIEVTSTATGTVKSIAATKGTAVNTGDVLIVVG